MVVNTFYRFLFVHVPKAGGTSVAATLSTLDGNHTGWIAKTKHETLAEFREAIAARLSVQDREQGIDPNAYYCCAFVRHPWDRLSSLYRYLREKRPRSEIDSVDSFKRFIALASMREPWIAGLHSMRQQVDYFTTPARMLDIDYLGHYEHLSEDVSSLGARIGLSLTIPHLNRSSNADIDYRRFYDAEMVDMVQAMFADDIRHFGYSFEERAPSHRISGRLSCRR